MAAGVLETWVQNSARIMLCRVQSDWNDAAVLPESVAPLLRANGERLRQLLAESNARLRPLSDPLLTDYGVHRWLSRSREEAYSSWLAWIISQLGDPDELFTMFGIEDAQAKVALQNRIPVPQCEVFAESGAPGHAGRIDIEVREPGVFLLLLELKLCAPEEAALSKQRGYAKWSLRRGVPKEHIHRRLVALRGRDDEYDGAFRLVTWDHVAISLRRLALHWFESESPNADLVVRAAQVLALAGAIEQNILDFSTTAARKATQGKPVSLPSAVVKHLESALGGNWNAARS